jgi:hypothetical protein
VAGIPDLLGEIERLRGMLIEAEGTIERPSRRAVDAAGLVADGRMSRHAGA